MFLLVLATLVAVLLLTKRTGLLKNLLSLCVSFFCYLMVVVFIVATFSKAFKKSWQKQSYQL